MNVKPSQTAELDRLRSEYRQSSHNTNGLKRSELAIQEGKFMAQQVAVYSLMLSAKRAHPASAIHERLLDTGGIKPNTPLTSIRRALSNLCEWGYMTMLPEQVRGIYGKPEALYVATIKLNPS